MRNRGKNPIKRPVITMKDVKVVLKRDPFIPLPKMNAKILQLIRVHTYAVDEIIWAKMKGYPLWPAKVNLF